MKKIYGILLVCLLKYGSLAVNIPGPSVYVVTPSPRSHQENEGRSAPFYYHNWMRRMDSPQNATTTSTTPKVKTPDLIFAEFESENGDQMRKSIRKLLEQERVMAKTTTTTSQPMYVPQASDKNVKHEIRYVVPKQESSMKENSKDEADKTDYFALYNNLYGDVNNDHLPKDTAPVYMPSTTPRTTTTTTTTTPAPAKVENIWHIIDSERHNQYSGQWEEVPLNSDDKDHRNDEMESSDEKSKTADEQDDAHVNDNFALPGFGSNSAKGAENESRAIHTEPNIQFPYVSLKPFLMKNMNKHNAFSQSKKSNNMFSTLDDFKDIKHPVRGEIQDIVPTRESVDRYNPAQPYLPHDYASKSKQSSPSAPPTNAVANLVPPPPPPPKATGDDFPPPTNYESFPPYPPLAPIEPPPPKPAVSVYKPPSEPSDDSVPYTSFDESLDDAPIDVTYHHYKPPPPPPSYAPSKPTVEYSYSKPESYDDTPPHPEISGYSYSKPSKTYEAPPPVEVSGYSYSKPLKDFPPPPPLDDLPAPTYDAPPPPVDYGYHYPPPPTTTETPRVNRFSYYYLGKKLYYLPLYFSVYFIVYVGALIIKAVLRHKIVYPNSWRPNDTTASFFAKRSVDSLDLSNENLHEMTGRVTKAIAEAAEKYINKNKKDD